MSLRLLLVTTILHSFANLIGAECANACNGHGKCTSYDMCICNRNWQSSDCSERVCQFGLAHVDTPKGDLDMNGVISGPDSPVVDNNFIYPYGTTEMFPAMQDSNLNTLEDTAHYYMECSNRGQCDRSSGECVCNEGYDGVACQRASCPGYPASCSGHGVCKTIKQLAQSDNFNIYELWDKDSTMGCFCDAGYGGPDCSQKLCKYGIDPLYLDDAATVKYSTFNFATLLTNTASGSSTAGAAAKLGFVKFTDGLYPSTGNGHWAIRFFDIHGEDWLTRPIAAGASCVEVVSALENLPNDVIPKGSLLCTPVVPSGGPSDFLSDQNWDNAHDTDPRFTGTHQQLITIQGAFWQSRSNPVTSFAYGISHKQDLNGAFPSSYSDLSSTEFQGYIYRIKFFGNPGKLREPEIELYLDGKRPALIATMNPANPIFQSNGGKQTETVVTEVWTDGQQGESMDYIADHCDGVSVTINTEGELVWDVMTQFTTGHVSTWTAESSYDASTQKYSFLSGLTKEESGLLKACLGGSDFIETNNIDVYDWDTGSAAYPHLVKLVRSVSMETDGGYYVALYYVPPKEDATNCNTYVDNVCPGTDIFKLLNPFAPLDTLPTDEFDIYTTKGVLARTTGYIDDNTARSSQAEAVFGFAEDKIYTYASPIGPYTGSVSCEYQLLNKIPQSVLPHCLNKTDLFLLFQFDKPALNPPHLNIHTAERLYSSTMQWDGPYDFNTTNTGFPSTSLPSVLGTHVIVSDISTNWASAPLGQARGATGSFEQKYHPKFDVYKFFPDDRSTYEYVAPCANRGLCDGSTGLCTCFPGYTSDSCSVQNSLAV